MLRGRRRWAVPPRHCHSGDRRIRRVGTQVPGAAAVIATECIGCGYSTPGKPRIDWTDS